MKRIIYISLIFILTQFLFSCTEKIELKLNEGYTRIVVEGSITDETKTHTIKLSKSTSYFYNQPSPSVSGAIVTISDGSIIIPLTETSPGIYQTASNIQGEPGKTYTLLITGIDINGDGEQEEYRAVEKMRNMLLLDSVRTELQNPGEIKPLYQVKGWGLEPPTLNDSYQWLYYINGELITDTINETIFTDDEFVNGSYIPGLLMFEDIDAGSGDTITVETRSITRQYLIYIFSLMAETTWSQGTAGGPPANIIGNIDNGGLGYFSANSVSYASTIIE